MKNCSSPDGWEWLTPDFYSGAYDRFIRLRWNIDPFPGEDLHLDPHAFVLSPEEQKKIPLPPRIEVGIAPNYRFERDGQNLRIYPHVDEPLVLSDAIDASVMQHRACVAAIRTFWLVLKARVAAI
jgi:hypothetical protein